MRLALRNVVFTLVVPGAGGVYAPWWILTHTVSQPRPLAWPAAMPIVCGAVLYTACQWQFASVGHGTPGVWDAPRRVVAAGPYRRVRNPIYLAALLVLFGEAWLFESMPLLEYAAVLRVAFHLLVVFYEEQHLGARFGDDYARYRRTVWRWIPHPP
jgi:protein-S-isoprenylcysteine O-methyltransferase Ste14